MLWRSRYYGFSKCKALSQPYGLLCINGPKAALRLNAPVLHIADELHDFWNVLLQLLATPNTETDSVEIRVHSAVKPCVLNKAVNLAHIVNSLRTGFNVDTAVSSKQIARVGCSHALWGVYRL